MARIRYTKANIFTSGEVKLMPGLNAIDDAKYEAVKDSPGWKNRVARGVIVVLPPKASAAQAEAPASAVDELTADDIAEMSDVIALRELSKSADKEIAKAANIRLAEIDAAEKNESKGNKSK